MGSDVILLPGFLGETQEMHSLFTFLQKDFTCHAFDLPLDIPSFIKSLDSLNISSSHLVGYSMGGRVALYLKKHFPSQFEKVIAISSHMGLKTAKEKLERWEIDLEWIKILKTKSLLEFLTLWYQQPIFKTLYENKALFEKTMKKRLNQNPETLCELLKRYSLAHQEFTIPVDAHFLCGAKDAKYVELYHAELLTNQFSVIENSGHAIHLENPIKCGEIICTLLTGMKKEIIQTSNIISGKE